jgi:hypothetical protein
MLNITTCSVSVIRECKLLNKEYGVRKPEVAQFYDEHLVELRQLREDKKIIKTSDDPGCLSLYWLFHATCMREFVSPPL